MSRAIMESLSQKFVVPQGSRLERSQEKFQIGKAACDDCEALNKLRAKRKCPKTSRQVVRLQRPGGDDDSANNSTHLTEKRQLSINIHED